MTTSFMISNAPTGVLTSVQTLCVLLDVSERRIQQLARAGIVVRKKHSQYDLILSVQGYVRYLRLQARKKAVILSAEALEEALGCLELPDEESNA